ncbi:MAG: hypothetical protein VB092_05455 [Oscillospiraceae bacterium]|nr:hypothetical protein [Oscillospiraceae bacterium]
MEDELLPDIERARDLMEKRDFAACEALLSTLMFQHPHDAVPHNLMGLLLERRGSHLAAMRHFRAACALEPGYAPAAWNLECYGEFARPHRCAFTAAECIAKTKKRGEV